MRLPDGTTVDVIDLQVLTGDTLTATLAILWPDGRAAKATIQVAPALQLSVNMLEAPSIVKPAGGGPASPV